MTTYLPKTQKLFSIWGPVLLLKHIIGKHMHQNMRSFLIMYKLWVPKKCWLCIEKTIEKLKEKICLEIFFCVYFFFPVFNFLRCTFFPDDYRLIINNISLNTLPITQVWLDGAPSGQICVIGTYTPVIFFFFFFECLTRFEYFRTLHLCDWRSNLYCNIRF